MSMSPTEIFRLFGNSFVGCDADEVEAFAHLLIDGFQECKPDCGSFQNSLPGTDEAVMRKRDKVCRMFQRILPSLREIGDTVIVGRTLLYVADLARLEGQEVRKPKTAA